MNNLTDDLSKDIEIAGRAIKNSNTYSKYYNEAYEVNGTPKGYDLEKIFASPQDHIEQIAQLAKYYYVKHGIIMRVVNIIRDFGVGDYRLSYPVKDQRVRKVIEDYNDRVETDELLRDIIFELALIGNAVIYDRSGSRVDMYPVSKVEVSPLVINNKPVLLYQNEFNLDSFGLAGGLSEDLKKKIEMAYPSEIARGIKENKPKIALDVDNSYYLKTNSSRYEPYGIPFILPAFDEISHKTVLKEAERSTATGVIEKVFMVKVGNKDHPPKQKEIDYYSSLFENQKGSLRTTVPYFVNAEWIEPDTSIFGKDKFEQVDLDILNALGISLTLIRGEGGGNYSEGFLSITGLIKTIENIRKGIPKIMKSLYAKELERNGLKADHAPNFKFVPVEIDKSAKMEMLQWLFQNAGLPYKVLYDEAGYDFLSVKLEREMENEEKMEDTFELRQQPFQGKEDGEGRPEKNITERKTDKSKSNNKSPRPSTSK